MPSASPRPGEHELHHGEENNSPIQVKQGLLLTTGWRSPTSQGKAVSGRKTKTGLRKHLQRDPLGTHPWILKEGLAWFYPHPLLRRAEERICLWSHPSGKGLAELFLANHTPFMGGNTNEKNRLWPRAQLGVPGGAGLGMIPNPSFPPVPLPPPSPAALDRCDSRGYDRAVARAKYLLGIPEP